MRRLERSGWLLVCAVAMCVSGAALSCAREVPEGTDSFTHKAMPLPGQPAPTTPLRIAFETQIDSILSSIDSLSYALSTRDDRRARDAFRNTRHVYKQAESLLELYTPSTTALLNGPALDDDGDAPPRPLGEPAGFQRVENVVFADSAMREHDALSAIADVAMMRSALDNFRKQTRLLHITEADFLDAARLELARVSTLGISGVDTDASDDAIPEQREALKGIRTLAYVVMTSEADVLQQDRWRRATDALGRAVGYASTATNFSDFDRLTFLTAYANPAARALADVRRSLPTPIANLRRAWRSSSATVWDENAFDAWAYSREYYAEYGGDTIPSASRVRNELGKRLFFDARLSGPGSRSCASCHMPEHGFSDGHARGPIFPGSSHGALRNVPTLLNAALQPRQFADSRAGSLEQQIGMVLSSEAEMGGSGKLASKRLSEDLSYRAQFRAAWGDDFVKGDTIGENALLVAVAAYVRSLTAMNSRFDRAVRGDSSALTAQERLGFNLFAGRARCATCHFAPIFNGTAAPAFATSEPEIINVPRSNVTSQARIDSDSGRARIDGLSQHLFAFKVPTVRNVALTAPYMHNGVFATLDQVVDFYDRGGGAGIGITSKQQTLRVSPLKLTKAEQSAIVAFLKSLTDESFVARGANIASRTLH